MSGEPSARTSKVRLSSRIRAKAGRRQNAPHHHRRANSKKAQVLALLRRPNGATITTIMRSTGWQPHTVRGFLAAVVRRKLGLRLESEKTKSERIYRVVTGGTPDSMGEPGA
jgi:hypothetical protein